MNSLTQNGNPSKHPPYSLTVKEAAAHFGFHPKTLYDWIEQGRLLRGTHYLRVGNRKIVIIRQAFIDKLYEEDGSHERV